MTNRTTEIRCVNKRCKTLNSLSEKFCHRCRTPIVKRYLKISGKLREKYSIGDLMCDRYLLCYPNTVLDTKPSLVPFSAEVIPEDAIPYLKLFSHRLHLPQLYSFLKGEGEAWLLEYESLVIDDNGELTHPLLFLLLEKSFSNASPLRQISWLWQMVQLWNPLEKQKVLSSFFVENNLRANGGILKIMELYRDEQSSPTLQTLGNLWSNWIPLLNPLTQEIMRKVTLCLQQNLITNTTQLLNILDQILFLLGHNFYQREFKIITATDAGKRRDKNEDYCYPPTDILKETKSGIDTLTMVCDGLGGQQSGEVASNLAVEIIQRELKQAYEKTFKETLNNKHWTPLIDAKKINSAIAKANDKISQINNDKNRKNRERMGTTVVTGMAIAHEVYLANVGDSRIYWITEDSCHQVTVDDDLASKEVRKGEGLYRVVVANPHTGALLQALGMESSKRLKVHIRRFITDEDSIFLLCSDGLSDYDRVEQYWQSEIVPVIRQEKTLEEACNQMMKIGVGKNGHDNVTIGMIHCHLKPKEKEEHEEELTWQYLQEIIPDLPQPKEINPMWQNFISHKPEWLDWKILTLGMVLLCFSLTIFLLWYNQKPSENKSSSTVINSFSLSL